MGLFDKAERVAEDLAEKHLDKVDQGIDRLAQEVDERTGGEHSE